MSWAHVTVNVRTTAGRDGVPGPRAIHLALNRGPGGIMPPLLSLKLVAAAIQNFQLGRLRSSTSIT